MSSRERLDDGLRSTVALLALAQVVVGVLAVSVVRNENWDEGERPIGPQTLLGVLKGDLGANAEPDEQTAWFAVALLLFAAAGFVLAFVVSWVRGRKVWSGLQHFAVVCHVLTALVLVATTVGDTERSELVAVPGMVVVALPLLLPLVSGWLFGEHADDGPDPAPVR